MHRTIMLYLLPPTISEARSLSQSNAPHSYAAITSVYIQWGQLFISIHWIQLPCYIYICKCSVRTGVCLTISHDMAKLWLCPHVFSEARSLCQFITPHCHTAHKKMFLLNFVINWHKRKCSMTVWCDRLRQPHGLTECVRT